MANTKEISWEEATGVTSAEGAVPKFGDAKEISWEDATGNPLPKPSTWERAKTAFGSVQEQTGGAQAQAGLKQVGQEVKALSNMLVGIPGGVAGVAADIGSRISSIAIGEDPKAAGLRARATAEKTNELWGKVTGALGLSQDASGSKIDELMGKGMEYSDVAGAQAEVATGGIVSKETVQSVRDTLLNALGVKGLAPGKIIAGRAAPVAEALTADAAIKASKARVEALAAEKATAELAKQAEDVAAGTAKAATVDALVKTALENQHPLDKAWSVQKAEAAPGTSPAWDTMVKGLVEPEPPGPFVGPKQSAPFQGPKQPSFQLAFDAKAEGKILTGEQARIVRDISPLTAEAIDNLRAGKLLSSDHARALRTLRVDAKNGQIAGPDGAVWFQRGAVDPTLLKVMGLMGLGAVAGTALYNWFQSPSGVSGDKSSELTPSSITPEQAAGLAAGLMGATVLHKAGSKFTDMPQPELIQAIKAGGVEAEGAARAIHDATRTQLEKSLYTFKDKLDVEGIVQKTYEKTFQAIASGQFKGESKLSTFMHSVAKNEALNELQARKARPQTVSMTEGPEGEVAYPEASVADTLTPERVAQNTEMAQKMQDSINKLPERQREVFNAAELDGLSYEEIAKTYDMEVGTVRSTLARAREALQKSLKDYKPTQQAGKIENELLIRAGVASGGATLGAAVADDPEKGAIIGGILGLAAASLGTKPVEQALGRGTTRLMEIDPQLRRTIREMELAASKEVSGASEAIVSFTKPLKKADPVTQVGITEAYYAADGHAMAEAVKGQPALVEGYRKVRQFLSKAEESLKTLGRFKEGVPDYLPLVVKDYPGLMASLGHEVRTGLSNMMHKANMEMVKKEGRELTNTERSILTNDFLRNDPATSFQPGFAKARRLKITPETQQFYMSMEDALIHYGHAAMQDVAMAKFFGKDLRQSGKEGHQYTNVDNSIGALTDRAMREKRMTPEQAVEVQQILRARFDKGTQAPSGWLQDVRNVSGAALLGQVGSGLIQTSEGLLSTYHHGIKPAVEAVGMLLTRKGIKPAEFGLANHVIEEVIGSRASGKVLSGLLKVNLLATLDQLGMSQNLTASFIKNRQLVNTAAGQAKLMEKWGADYGPDMPQLMAELKASTTKSRTPLVDSLLYQELSDVRPTSRSEAPELFNAHPNARLAYHLKQFMITQADVIRRDSWMKIKTGEPKKVAEGLKNLALYSAALSVVTVPSDAIKNWMMGRPLKLDNIDYVENFVRNFGLSRYTMTQVANSEVPGQKMMESAGSMVTPPVASVMKTLGQGMSDPKKLVPFVPLVGRVITNRELGGNERWAKGEQLKARLEARDARESLYPALRARRLLEAKRKKAETDRKAAAKQRSAR